MTKSAQCHRDSVNQSIEKQIKNKKKIMHKVFVHSSQQIILIIHQITVSTVQTLTIKN